MTVITMLFAGGIMLAVAELISGYNKEKTSKKTAKFLNILNTTLRIAGCVLFGLPVLYAVCNVDFGSVPVTPFLFYFLR